MPSYFFHLVFTILLIIAFIGICWWAYSPKSKQRFKEAANLALDDTEDSKSESESNKQKGARFQ